MGLSGRAGGSGLSNTSWFCTPLTPNQLARAWHLNPSHSLLIPRVTDHRTFFLACSTKVHQLGVLRNRPQQLSTVQPPWPGSLLCQLWWASYFFTQLQLHGGRK